MEIGDDWHIMSGQNSARYRMGKGNKVHHNAVLGAEPQDFHYTGENSMLIIGDNNDIRENVVVAVLPMQEAPPASAMKTT